MGIHRDRLTLLRMPYGCTSWRIRSTGAVAARWYLRQCQPAHLYRPYRPLMSWQAPPTEIRATTGLAGLIITAHTPTQWVTSSSTVPTTTGVVALRISGSASTL